MLDVFKTDAFGLVALTEAINKQPHKPMQIGASGAFIERGIRETKVSLEERDGQIELVQSKKRGEAGQVLGGSKRKLRAVNVPHLPIEAGIEADEVQNVRAFGSENNMQVLQEIVNERLAEMRDSLEVTIEHLRAGAIQGLIKDADGTTLLNLFTEFGVVQQIATLSYDSDADNGNRLKNGVIAAQRLIEAELGAAPITGFRAYCGSSFFDDMRSDLGVVQTLRWADPQALLQQEAGVRRFNFGGVQWEEYRGSTGGTPFFADTEAYLFPIGPSIFRTYFAPANYTETVNTLGLPFYAKQALRKFEEGIDLKAQSNPLCICLRPRAVIKLTLAS